jgi:hypothetical protein
MSTTRIVQMLLEVQEEKGSNVEQSTKRTLICKLKELCRTKVGEVDRLQEKLEEKGGDRSVDEGGWVS